MATQGFASIGIDVSVNSVSLNYVQDIGDIGGTPSELDATCLKDTMKKQVPGVQDIKTWECTYLFDNSAEDSDYRTLKALQDAGSIVPVAVTFPDGTIFSSTGYVNTYISGAKVDELVTAKLAVSIQSDWVVTDPSAT
ncbi:MAG: phage tail protein [Clostridiales bacterium]|nr:phage tail protein [Clostridiales bacterium]MCD8368433.1 phage tail protein [Clostridiales bacterium]